MDNKFAFGLNEQTVVDYGLYENKKLTDQEVQILERQSEVGKLFDLALRFLEYRPRSEKEVQGYLRQRLYKQKIKLDATDQTTLIENILKRLHRLDLLNDLNFAQWWIRQRQGSSKPKGLKLIRLELWQKGISEETITKAFQQLESTSDEFISDEKLARKALEKVSYRYKDLDKRTRRQKLSQHLLRRGFGWDTVKEVLASFDL